MMFHSNNSTLSLALVLMMMVVGVVSSTFNYNWLGRYSTVFVAHNPVPATWFHSNALRFLNLSYDKYDSYYPDLGEYLLSTYFN